MSLKKVQEEKQAAYEAEIRHAKLPRGPQLIGVVDQRIGRTRMRVRGKDGKPRLCRIPGRLKRRLWVREGDTVLVKPGEKVPADGIITEGEASVDESLISGESKPMSKKSGDGVVAGSIALDGLLTVTLSRVGENSTIGQIQKLITEAQKTKPRTQRIADKASAILTFTAGIVALLTILVWSVMLGEPFVFSMTLAITVLVIACPHALGLAIPTVTTITTSLAVKNGVFIKDLSKIEVIRKADYIVLDKTGTMTKGEFGVTNIVPITVSEEKEILQIAASLGANASHVIDFPIVKQAQKDGLILGKVSGFTSVGGRGILGEIDGKKYFLGNKAFVEENSKLGEKALDWYEKLSNKGETVIFLSNSQQVMGLISLADEIRDDSQSAIDQLHKLGLKVAMLTGDNEQVARGVAQSLGIDTYFAEVLPEDKYKYIKELQDKGSVVLMVGDGINDAPALTQADAGIAIGAGTDIAIEAGDVVLTRNNPLDIPKMIKLAKVVYQKMIQNLVWALGYNIIAIPAAAGVFAVWGFFLRPEIGALVMSLSTVIVVINALTLKKINLNVA